MVCYWVQILKMLFQNVDITCQFTENIDGFIYHIRFSIFFCQTFDTARRSLANIYTHNNLSVGGFLHNLSARVPSCSKHNIKKRKLVRYRIS